MSPSATTAGRISASTARARPPPPPTSCCITTAGSGLPSIAAKAGSTSTACGCRRCSSTTVGRSPLAIRSAGPGWCSNSAPRPRPRHRDPRLRRCGPRLPHHRGPFTPIGRRFGRHTPIDRHLVRSRGRRHRHRPGRRNRRRPCRDNNHHHPCRGTHRRRHHHPPPRQRCRCNTPGRRKHHPRRHQRRRQRTGRRNWFRPSLRLDADAKCSSSG